VVLCAILRPFLDICTVLHHAAKFVLHLATITAASLLVKSWEATFSRFAIFLPFRTGLGRLALFTVLKPCFAMISD
jgi:hypothetical protein